MEHNDDPTKSRIRGKGWIVGIVAVVAVALVVAGDSLYSAYAYSIGTSATAKVDDCTGGSSLTGGKSRPICWATWTIDGEYRYGEIKGGNLDAGDTVDVRAHNKVAYTTYSAVFGPVAAAAIAVGVPIGVLVYTRRRRRQ